MNEQIVSKGVVNGERGTRTMNEQGKESPQQVVFLQSLWSSAMCFAQMNDAAVALLLERRDCKAASALLSDAVALIIETRRQHNLGAGQQEQSGGKSLACDAATNAHCLEPCDSNNSEQTQRIFLAPQASDDILTVSPSPLALEGGSMAVCARPFVFRHHLGPANVSQEKDIETFFAGGIAVCIYNLAICKHHEWKRGLRSRAVSRGERDNAMLQEVVSLYQKSLNILVGLKPSLSGSMTILIAALCHNLSSIYFDKGDLKQVKTWKQVLTHALEFVDTSRLDNEAYQFFLMSTALSGVETVAAGAA